MLAEEGTPFYIVAAHGGAGDHHISSEPAVRQALRNAFRALGAQTATALDLTTALISSLEDAEPLNTGYGANLTLSGRVECDAALMDAKTNAFGAVGAIGCVKNPVQLARIVLENRGRRDTLGRVPPLLLAGAGAADLARSTGMTLVDRDAMIAPRARKDWEIWRDRLEKSHKDDSVATVRQSLHSLQDTVGAVAWDTSGNLAAGVSSGGLLLKSPGRIGEAAIYGAGCWAQQSSTTAVACSVSGEGELIIQSALAKTLADALNASRQGDTHETLKEILVDRFYKHWKRLGEPGPAAGVLLLTKEVDGTQSFGRLWCAFTTPSMAVAYASSVHPKPKVTILRNTTHSYEDEARSPIFITALPL
ncbi:N-terminal nucleophile aminohydrolase [Artomyces pyxidatus]|uniref:N-terminal nucleophile aminohydrolase n=1 Tax=Artomyces pyxidatus TaxID=48021 RepID=A0ACB8T2X9_9AGAM|nr:N-terminal nucleophile aminohydrolase [Artomyces pyxidatus]